MKFQTQYTHEKSIPEKNSGERLIEKAGYITAQKRIENLMLAGKRLTEARNEQYDFNGPIDENFSDPTRYKGLDMGEAFQIKLSIDERLKSQKDIMDASQSSQDAPGKVDMNSDILTEGKI